MGLGCTEIRNLKCWGSRGAKPLLTEKETLLGEREWPTSASHQPANTATIELNLDHLKAMQSPEYGPNYHISFMSGKITNK